MRISSLCGRFFLLVSLLATLGSAARATTPAAERNGLLHIGADEAPLALVLFPGAFVESEKYVELATAIVAESRGDVGVFIASRFANVTNPIEARGRIQTVINLMAQQGDGNPRRRIFVAGHSQGGIGAFGLPVSMDLGGLVLLASYIPRTVVVGQTLEAYEKPVLTLGGELDGLTGINYLAREAQSAQRLAAQDDRALLEKPVIVLPGVNHMQFADGSAIAGDLPYQVVTKEAHAQIARRIVNFLAVHAPTANIDREAAVAAQLEDVETTLGMIKPYSATSGVEGGFCERAQVRASGLDLGAFERIDFDTKLYSGVLGQAQFVLDKAKVEQSGDRYRLHLPVFVQASPGPLDISKDHALSPQSMWCKMRTPEALSADTGAVLSGEPTPGCAELNQWVIEETLGLLETSARTRLEARYGTIADWRPVLTADEGATRLEYGPFVIKSSPVGTGQGWVAGKFSLKPEGDGWEIKTVELTTGLDTWVSRFAGAHYCKIVTPGRIVEWATLFGLKS